MTTTIKSKMIALVASTVTLLAAFTMTGTHAALSETIETGGHEIFFNAYEPQNFAMSLVATGENFSLGFGDGGLPYAWGNNEYGRTGIGRASGDTSTPTLITTEPGIEFVELFSGTQTAYAIDQNGDLWGWGRNNRGQLGVGDTVDRLTPTRIPAPAPGVKYTQVEASDRGCCTFR